MDEPWLRFLVAVLATWRLATLLAHDDGPWDAMLRLRRLLGDGQLGRMLDCFRCVSLWVAAPLAFTVGSGPLEWLLAWLALSGAACLLDRFGQPPVSIQRLDDQGDAHELLRTEPLGDGEPDADPARHRTSDAAASIHVVR